MILCERIYVTEWFNMEKINYSLVEYFQNKYGLDVSDGWGKYELGQDPWDGIQCIGTNKFNKLKSDLRNILWAYNLSIFKNDGILKGKNKVSYSNEYNHYIFNVEEGVMVDSEALIERGLNGYLYSILDFKGFSNITPEIFLEDIKNILEKYSVKPTKAGEPTKGLNNVESVFIKYIDIKTPQHIVKERQEKCRYTEIQTKRYNELKDELKQYKDLKELQDMKDLVEKNKSLMEENAKLVEKEDIRKKVQQWLENNSDKINFKTGKELYDII